MQQITGRLTADATVRQLDSGREVVSFNVVDNQSYRPKGSDEPVDIPTFFNCSYWLSTGVAKVLRKGAVVQLNGRVSARAYTTNTDGLAASLNFHTSRIDVLTYAPKKEEEGGQSKAKNNSGKGAGKADSKKQQEENKDDLPF